MKIEIRDIDEHTFSDLPPECSGCLYWEAPENFLNGSPGITKEEAVEIKRDWFNTSSDVMGNCGKILYEDGKAAGYAQYAFPQLLKYASEYSSELFPPGSDAILLSCLYIRSGHQGKGLGTILLQTVLEDLRQKDFKALETYSRDDSANNCSGPTSLYLENGFKKLNTGIWGNASFSLVRYELR